MSVSSALFWHATGTTERSICGAQRSPKRCQLCLDGKHTRPKSSGATRVSQTASDALVTASNHILREAGASCPASAAAPRQRPRARGARLSRRHGREPAFGHSPLRTRWSRSHPPRIPLRHFAPSALDPSCAGSARARRAGGAPLNPYRKLSQLENGHSGHDSRYAIDWPLRPELAQYCCQREVLVLRAPHCSAVAPGYCRVRALPRAHYPRSVAAQSGPCRGRHQPRRPGRGSATGLLPVCD
jgi:hypothetical protein